MEDMSFGRGRSQENDDNGERVEAKNSEEMEVALGDIIWIMFADSSWWPAVVVDDNGVSPSYKPDERSMRAVLVRLYGSYDLYVDPAEYRSESEFMLKQSNGCFRTTFREILEQELQHSKNGQSKRRGSKSIASIGVKDGAKRKLKLDRQQEEQSKAPRKEASAGRSLKLTPRRFKVMQTLGLAAPLGSPFLKNGDTFAAL